MEKWDNFTRKKELRYWNEINFMTSNFRYFELNTNNNWNNNNRTISHGFYTTNETFTKSITIIITMVDRNTTNEFQNQLMGAKIFLELF